MSSTIDKVLLNTETHDEFIRQLMSSIVIASKESAIIPKGSDFTYYSMDPEFSNASKQLTSLTKDMMETICNYVKPNEITRLSDDMSNNSTLYNQIMDVVDLLLENADKSLNLASKEKQLSTSVRQTLSVDKEKLLQENEIILLKPQLYFMNEIDNSRNQPFRPRLTIKYHAITPLDNKMCKINEQNDHTDQYESNYSSTQDNELSLNVYFPHPYETELRNLECPSWCKYKIQHINPSPTYAQTAYMFIDNETLFNTMLEELLDNSIDELAIDLEHHSYHSFQGLTCLMQISSRKQDFIVDTLALRQIMPLLGQVFCNPKIVKVFHGCDKDILWLQRDFGLYIINCFDTHIAAKALRYPVLSLAHLLRYHCDITADKKHQLSDWRQRPISNEMLHYAQQDTKYLLYIYDAMRKELFKTLGLIGIEHVFDASKQLCLNRYEKMTFNPEGYQMILQQDNKTNQHYNKEKKKSSKPVVGTVGKGLNITESDLNVIQEGVLSALWEWRDSTAREEDESYVAIMTNAELLRIGMNIPMNLAMLEQKCNPLSKYTRQHAEEILLIIKSISSIGPINTLSEYNNDFIINDNIKNSAINNNNNQHLRSSYKDIDKSLQEDTIYTFTPAILYPNATATTSTTPLNNHKNNRQNSSQLLLPHTHVNQLNSPVPPVDEIFRQAGWSTPQSKGQLYSCSPVIFDTMNIQEISTDNKKRMEKSMEEIHSLYTSKNDFKNKVKDLVTSTEMKNMNNYINTKEKNINNTIDIDVARDKLQHIESTYHNIEINECGNNNNNNNVDDNDDNDSTNICLDLIDIPKSFDEIYSLSIRNRQKNKEKKRLREGEGYVDSSQDLQSDHNNIDLKEYNNKIIMNKTSLLETSTISNTTTTTNIESNISIDKYFPNGLLNNTTTIDIGLENTLAFASSIGWLESSVEIEAMRQNHIEDLNYQRNSDLVDSNNPDQEYNNHNNKNIINNNSNNNTNNSCTSNYLINMKNNEKQSDRDISGIKDNKQSSTIATNAAVPKVFNYSKAVQHNSIGLLNNKTDEYTNNDKTNNAFNSNNKNNRKNNKNNKGHKNNASTGNPFLFGTGK